MDGNFCLDITALMLHICDSGRIKSLHAYLKLTLPPPQNGQQVHLLLQMRILCLFHVKHVDLVCFSGI